MSDMPTIFNPDPEITRIATGDGRFCYVVDNALVDPERMVQFAIRNRELFTPPDRGAYPGIALGLPSPVKERLDDFFAQHIRRQMGGRRTLRSMSRYSMVTLGNEQLLPRQCIAHVDAGAIQPGEIRCASVLYLFKDEGLGGTNFFEPKRPADELIQFMADSIAMERDEFASRYQLPLAYQVESNDYMKLIATIPAKWNRMIFYDGMTLHCGNIRSPEKLNSDPATGRLTVNGFFTCRSSL